jgi:hypothetical protein
MPAASTAFADESLRVRDELYILAAVIAADQDADEVRNVLRELRQRRQARLHWREESSKRRSALVTAIARLPHTGVIVAGHGMAPGRQERARRQCIERLLTELAGQGTGSVVFERRHPDLDARGRRVHGPQVPARLDPRTAQSPGSRRPAVHPGSLSALQGQQAEQL